jgi:zinc and cadmium transporter
MPVLAWILFATLLGGVLSVLAAAALTLRTKPVQLPVLVSYSIGTLLGAVFLEILPEAFRLATSIQQVSATILAGLLLFFVLEKVVLWRHCHQQECGVHTAPPQRGDGGRIAAMVVIGDTFHNCVDGVIIAGAFLVSVDLGIVTALAIISHEVPQEVGDFMVLLHSGYSKKQALALNLLASGSMVGGGLIAYYALHTVKELIPPLLGVAAASMLYIAVADLIPGLHRRPGIRATIQQALLIGAGVATIWGVGLLADSIAPS